MQQVVEHHSMIFRLRNVGLVDRTVAFLASRFPRFARCNNASIDTWAPLLPIVLQIVFGLLHLRAQRLHFGLLDVPLERPVSLVPLSAVN